MKTIGLVGGITWYSSIDYYRYINELVNKRLGGDDAAKVILNSVNYGEIKKLTLANDWKSVANIICTAAKKTQEAGADCILLCANTMHNIADEVQQVISIPFIHIADAAARKIKKAELKTIALLGTKYTMQLNFFKDRLSTTELRH
jgi:aspartate racemase